MSQQESNLQYMVQSLKNQIAESAVRHAEERSMLEAALAEQRAKVKELEGGTEAKHDGRGEA